MIKLDLNPISTNRMYSGRRWLSQPALQFREDCKVMLIAQRQHIPDTSGDLMIRFKFGISRDKDVSNCIKLVEDVICEVYGIDDSQFLGLMAEKVRVPKGHEFIEFDICDYHEGFFEWG